MKKLFTVLVVVLFAFTSVFAQGSKEAAASNVIKVGATPDPHAILLNLVVDDLAAEGYTLQVIEFTDYVTPNDALESGEIDANYFQHIPYLESFNTEHGYHLVNAGGIHVEPLALYSKKVASLADLKNGATIAIPNDPTNEGRALLLLQSAGLIKLSDKAGLEATPADIVENAKGLKFKEIEAAKDLGAGSILILFKIIIPLTVSGIVSGIVMVFVPSLTSFAISQVLGGGKVLLIGNVIEQDFIHGSQWNAGSGLSLILMVFVLISMALVNLADKDGEGTAIW